MMEFPSDLLYTSDHEWVRIEGNLATVGVTAFATRELGDIVYIDITTLGETLDKHATFGTIEAVKTVSDLFMPVGGKILEVNGRIIDQPELVNKDSYNNGWLVRIEIESDLEGLLNVADYRKLIGQ